MKITTNWLKDHLDTKLNENQIIDKLTNIGLEVESVDSQSSDLDSLLIAKIIRAEKNPVCCQFAEFGAVQKHTNAIHHQSTVLFLARCSSNA